MEAIGGWLFFNIKNCISNESFAQYLKSYYALEDTGENSDHMKPGVSSKLFIYTLSILQDFIRPLLLPTKFSTKCNISILGKY